ncbi:MAG: hybrid sensor histidine kinase/response regulator [Anaerolineae bacterium]|nr:hybrid sensor histidine kinase/response regulator [Anaerolineae bacterium]
MPKNAELTILIADDERALASAIAAMLNHEGLETVVAYDGEEALRQARELIPDLILLDVMMPRLSGIEVCATLKTNPETVSIPIILITAKAEKADRLIGLAAGADDYLTKPFSPTELIALVDEVLGDRPITPRKRAAKPPVEASNQIEVYARELRELVEEERKKREALEDAQQRLGELDQLKTEFLGAVTNELLTPFVSVGVAFQVLGKYSDLFNPQQISALEGLGEAIAMLHRRVKGVVKFAELVNKRRTPQPGYYHLNQVIPWAVKPVAEMAITRRIDFRVFLPPDLPKVHVDPELLGEAVFQMAHNAIRFNCPGGWARLQAGAAGEWVKIEVTDSGVGLTPEQMHLLRQPLHQSAVDLQKGQAGLGFGWAFACYVAQAHNGRTHVMSYGPDQGSRFSLAIPAADEIQP